MDVVGVQARLADHRAAVTVADQHDVRPEAVDERGHRFGIAVQVTRR